MIRNFLKVVNQQNKVKKKQANKQTEKKIEVKTQLSKKKHTQTENCMRKSIDIDTGKVFYTIYILSRNNFQQVLFFSLRIYFSISPNLQSRVEKKKEKNQTKTTQLGITTGASKVSCQTRKGFIYKPKSIIECARSIVS